jgi:ATP-dependent DNA helicase RecQ
VISPLLALMRDQITHLQNRFKIPAGSINSDQSEEENNQIWMSAQTGLIKVLFVSPELLDHIDRFQFLLNLPISLIVIDEAHCISTWGHDFRPGYRQILNFTSQVKSAKILGLTATADQKVQEDIVKALSTPNQPIQVLRESMDRPNIELSTLFTSGLASKLSFCKMLLSQLEGSGLIYCATRENAEIVAEYLQTQGISIAAYHAGFDPEKKRELQTAFTNDHFKVVAATTALGMGIDKPNLRFIIHFETPGSITAYYQEVGRAGRDGLKAQGILLYDSQDKKVQEYFIDSSLPSMSDFEKILQVVKEAKEPPNLTKIKRETGLHPTRVTIVLAELVEQGHLTKTSVKGSQVYQITELQKPINLDRYTIQHQVKLNELNKILSYAENRALCRMAILRKSLGDMDPLPCGRCDICRKTIPLAAPATDAENAWLLNRTVPIAEAKTEKLSAGLSLLDGKLRAPLFINFMKQRKDFPTIGEELLALLIKQAAHLHKKHSFQGIVLLPSNTWKARTFVGEALSKELGIPLFADLLSWKEAPTKRQGELLNNDQRQFNVKDKMELTTKDLELDQGPLLLLDDYIGSGATMKEAARTLRKTISTPLVPLTICHIQWRLGQPGFI